MTTLAKWNPYREMNDLQNSLSSLFGNWTSWTPVHQNRSDDDRTYESGWTPLVDITEDDSEYLIKLELPEVRKEDLKVNVEEGVLTIKGERPFEKEKKGKRYHRVERAYGAFARSFTLPEDGDPSSVNAKFKNGLLEVHIVKDEKAKPKAVEIKVA